MNGSVPIKEKQGMIPRCSLSHFSDLEDIRAVSELAEGKDFTSQRATVIFNIKEELRLLQTGAIWIHIDFRNDPY